MSRIEIKADLESTDIVFDYTGADLQKPLADLIEHLRAEADRLMRQTGVKSARDLPVMADLGKRDHDAEAKQKIKLALSDLFEAQLWAAECKRTPEKVWRLTMSKLKWIYRQQGPS